MTTEGLVAAYVQAVGEHRLDDLRLHWPEVMAGLIEREAQTRG